MTTPNIDGKSPPATAKLGKEMSLEPAKSLFISAIDLLGYVIYLIAECLRGNDPSESQIKFFSEKVKQFRELYEICNLFDDGDEKNQFILKSLKEIEESTS